MKKTSNFVPLYKTTKRRNDLEDHPHPQHRSSSGLPQLPPLGFAAGDVGPKVAEFVAPQQPQFR